MTKNNDNSATEILNAIVEALFQLKDRLLARDKDNMFQDQYEMEQFSCHKSMSYIKQWLNI
eukprot:1549886-Ditylum_brightwellii.AAC.1